MNENIKHLCNTVFIKECDKRTNSKEQNKKQTNKQNRYCI